MPKDVPNSDNDIGPAEATHAERTSKRPWIALALLGVLLLGCLVPVALTATPRACATCHEMKPYYDSWQSSSHRAAVRNCLYCHVRPGPLNVVAFEFGFYREIAAHFAGAQVSTAPANAPTVESCRRKGCHSLNRTTSNSGDIKINHALHVTGAGVACPTCHPGAVHVGVAGRTTLPPMKLCKECHADRMSDCTFCHTQQRLKAPPGAH